MTIFELVEEWGDISLDRKAIALEAVMDYLSNNIEDNEDLIEQIFELLAEHEADDYFGTEGFNV